MSRRSSVSLKESTFGVINKLIRGHSTDNEQALGPIDRRTHAKWPPEKTTLPLRQIREDNNGGDQQTFPLRRELSYNQIRRTFEESIAPEATPPAKLPDKRRISLKQRRQSFFSRSKKISVDTEEKDTSDSSCPIYAKRNVVLRRKSVFAAMGTSISTSIDDNDEDEEEHRLDTATDQEGANHPVLPVPGSMTTTRPTSIALNECSAPFAGTTTGIPSTSLSPTFALERKNSMNIHEIRVLSPRNSLGGVFYSSSVISVKNSNSKDNELNLLAEGTSVPTGKKNGYVQRMKTSAELERIRKFCIYFKWTSWMSEREEHSLFVFSPGNSIRQYCYWLADHPYFDYVVLIFISLNCITLAMERPKIPPWSREREFLSFANYVFTIVFGLEMLIKVIAKGLFYGKDAYFHNGWNIMDGSLVGISLFDIFLSFFAQRSPRIFGILRVFRLLRSLRPLRYASPQ